LGILIFVHATDRLILKEFAESLEKVIVFLSQHYDSTVSRACCTICVEDFCKRDVAAIRKHSGDGEETKKEQHKKDEKPLKFLASIHAKKMMCLVCDLLCE